MKLKHTLKYIINLFFALCFVSVVGQESLESEKDSVVYKSNYGIRLGVDISKPVRGFIQDFYSGFEIVADYRITENLYIAAELGTEEQTFKEDYFNATGKGQYMRVGINLNTYKNWLDMNNEIFVGFRYGLSLFDQTINNRTINTGPEGITPPMNTSPLKYEGLNAHWGELMVGIKAEVVKNMFVSASFSYKVMVSVSEPSGIKSLFAPGFNRIFASNTGFGFNYTLSYLIPFSKK